MFLFELIGGKMEKIRNFFAGVKKEMKRVKWPTFKELLKNFISTMIFIFFFCGFFYLVDLLFALVKGLFN